MANTMLNDKTFADGSAAIAPGTLTGQAGARSESGVRTMTIGGTSLKAALLVVIALVAGTFGWQYAAKLLTGYSALIFLVVYLGLIGVTFYAARNPRVAIVLGPVYAVVAGTWAGAISAVYNAQFQGIVLQALLATATVMLATLVLYAFRVVRVTNRFVQVVLAMTFGVLIMYLVLWVASLFGFNAFASGWLGFAISLFTAGVAAFNLFVDYHFIEQGVDAGAPASMEWYSAFGLLATLVWLYLELLRLLSYLRN